MINRLKIAILRGGGNFGERDICLESGLVLSQNLSKEKYIISDVIISRDGNWYLNGVIIRPENLFNKIDFVFNLFDESGKTQKILEHFKIPYCGADSLASAVSFNKNLSKKIFRDFSLKTPYGEILKKENYDENSALKIFRSIPLPLVVKPAKGNFLGETVNNLSDLKNEIEKAFNFSDVVLVEEFIRGREVLCGVIDSFRKNKIYSFLPIEIDENFEKKFPPRLNKFEKEEVQKLAKLSHKILGLRHYSHSNFIISKRGIYILGTKSLPIFSRDSFLPLSLDSVGLSFGEFVEHLIFVANKNT